MKAKNKLIAGLGLIATLSVGIVVNSQKLGGGSKNENYSEALNKDFTGEVSTYNKDKFNILAPGEQFWDGLTPEEKAGKVLVVPKHKQDKNENIDYQNYENLVIEKKDKYGKGIQGIQFCIAKYPRWNARVCDEAYDYSKWITGEDGKLEISTNELPLYNQTLIEIGETAKQYRLQKIDLYVDPGNRFLGEVKGVDFITYDELIATINGADNPKEKKYKIGEYTKIGYVLSKGNDTATGGNWLKIYDAREGKILYIAKKPLTNLVYWNSLFNAGVVYGLDQIDTSKEALEEFKTTKKLKMSKNYTGDRSYTPRTVEIGGNMYIIRLLKGHATIKNGGDPNKASEKVKGEDIIYGSEWNRNILPLVKGNAGERWGSKNRMGSYIYTEGYIERDLISYKIQLADYSWFKDLRDSGVRMAWTQEFASVNGNKRVVRGGINPIYGAAYADSSDASLGQGIVGFIPVLEEISIQS